MLLFIEGYAYDLKRTVSQRLGLSVAEVLRDVVAVPLMEERLAFPYVGYCFNRAIGDVIFFLPKVVLTGELSDGSHADTLFGACPEDIIDFEQPDLKRRFTEEGHSHYKEFLSSLSIWIYRAIAVYLERHNDHVLRPKEHLSSTRGPKNRHNSLLDIIIALLDFNRQHQDYLTFTTRNMHAGLNKINWTKTLSRSQAYIQGATAVYLDPVNKRKQVDMDEELLIIYYSILNYLKEQHGFAYTSQVNYQLIPPRRPRSLYIERGYGKRRLKKIRYKYYSDRDLRMWELCLAFFDRSHEVMLNLTEDYLLVTDFATVFERMVDHLVSDETGSQLPPELKQQRDGKLVDHLFQGEGLISLPDLEPRQTYYIGDSKYYKRNENGVTLGAHSIYKQYTYARNVIQWNMNLFLGLEPGEQDPRRQLLDPLTEGYNPIPNFFISSRIPPREQAGEKFLSFDDATVHPIAQAENLNRHFENRLFDRDTLLLCHFDVNFLYLVSLYGRDNRNRQATWRAKVQRLFREKIRESLNKMYRFHLLQPRKGKDCAGYLREHFRELNGKVYRPSPEANHLVLALLRVEAQEQFPRIKYSPEALERIGEESEQVKESLGSHFIVSEAFPLGEQPPLAPPDQVGTLAEGQPTESAEPCVLAASYSRMDDVPSELWHNRARELTLRRIPSEMNLQQIRYFLPILEGDIEGYYEVERLSFGTEGDRLVFRLQMGEFKPLGRARVGNFLTQEMRSRLLTLQELQTGYMRAL